MHDNVFMLACKLPSQYFESYELNDMTVVLWKKILCKKRATVFNHYTTGSAHKF